MSRVIVSDMCLLLAVSWGYAVVLVVGEVAAVAGGVLHTMRAALI